MAKAKSGDEIKVKGAGGGRKADVLKVSKSIKCQAAFASLRGLSFRSVIRVMGEADESYKKNGRLILGGKQD